MANQQGNFGFRPVLMQGSAYNGQGQQQMTIASNETNSIFMGDPVVLNANGSISRGSSAGAELVGIFDGVLADVLCISLLNLRRFIIKSSCKLGNQPWAGC